MPLQERLRLKSKQKNGDNNNNKELRIDEDFNLRKDTKKRKREQNDDDFEIFNEDPPVPKQEKPSTKIGGGNRKAKNNLITDEDEDIDFSTNFDEKFKF